MSLKNKWDILNNTNDSKKSKLTENVDIVYFNVQSSDENQTAEVDTFFMRVKSIFSNNFKDKNLKIKIKTNNKVTVKNLEKYLFTTKYFVTYLGRAISPFASSEFTSYSKFDQKSSFISFEYNTESKDYAKACSLVKYAKKAIELKTKNKINIKLEFKFETQNIKISANLEPFDRSLVKSKEVKQLKQQSAMA